LTKRPGASPETFAATPLERQFGHIAALTEMIFTSPLGGTGIMLQSLDSEAAINSARGYPLQIEGVGQVNATQGGALLGFGLEQCA
jgi:hypothetical protein